MDVNKNKNKKIKNSKTKKDKRQQRKKTQKEKKTSLDKKKNHIIHCRTISAKLSIPKSSFAGDSGKYLI